MSDERRGAGDDGAALKALPATLQWFHVELGGSAPSFGQDLGVVWGPLDLIRSWCASKAGSDSSASMDWMPALGRADRALGALGVSLATMRPGSGCAMAPPELVATLEGSLVCANVGVGVFGPCPGVGELGALARGAMEREMRRAGLSWEPCQALLAWDAQLDRRAGALAEGRLEKVGALARSLAEAAQLDAAAAASRRGPAGSRI